MESYIVLFVCFGLIAMAKPVKVKQRLTIVESHLNLLELKADLAADNIKENSRMLVELNRTVLEQENCLVRENDTPLETADKSRHDSMDASDEDIHSRTVLRAFKKEKSFVRKQVRRLSNAISHFEDDRRQSNHSTVSELESIRTEMKALALAEEHHRTEMNDALASVQERHRLDIETLKTTHQIELANLKAWINSTCIRKQCPQNWTVYENFCYKFFDDRKTYKEARLECLSHSAYVVDIQDEDEMDFVKRFSLDSGSFIGLQNKDSDGTWVWERTGKEASYTNWAQGEPRGRGKCAGVRYIGGLWADFPCDVQFYEAHSVCKMKKGI